MTVSIIKASDLILLPVQPSSVDLWSVGTIIDHVPSSTTWRRGSRWPSCRRDL
jgi:cellulose biosynthesis protein BcsQ